MKFAQRATILCAMTLGLATAATAQRRGGSTSKGDPWDWSGSMSSGKTVTVDDVNGSVRAVAASGNTIVVHAIKSWRRGNPANVAVRSFATDEGMTFCAVHLDRAKNATDCEEKSQHGGWNENDDVSVDFTVEVPANILFDGQTVNGSVDAIGLIADAHVETVNGDVTVETAGTAHASTVNGSVHVTMGKMASEKRTEFESVNGDITLTIPANANLDLDASTTNGDISSDFAVTVQGRMSHESLRGRIGNGGQLLKVSTVNGSVKIRKLG